MFKRITLIKRKPGLDDQSFAHHWLEVHSRLARELEGLRGYRINVINESLVGAATDEWDGVGEMWFDSRSAAEAAFAKLFDVLEEDLAHFVAEKQTYLVDEHTIVGSGLA